MSSLTSTAAGAEASAACSVALFGGVFGFLPSGARPEKALSIAVALDRRPFARAEVSPEGGVFVESKDSLLKIEAAAVPDLSKEGLIGLVRRVLLDLGVERGVRVLVQARVPVQAGLGSGGALAVALGAAAAHALGRPRSAEALGAFALRGEIFAPVLPAAGYAAVWGGLVAAGARESSPPAERLKVDPARVEECLLLVDLASVAATVATAGAVTRDPEDRVSPSAAEEAARVALAGRDALQARRFGELPGLLAAEQQSWRNCLGPLGKAFEALAVVSGAAGGVAIPCGQAPQSLALVWASPGERGPGPRESLQAALKGAGYRTFPCRVDLRGLELEEG